MSADEFEEEIDELDDQYYSAKGVAERLSVLDEIIRKADAAEHVPAGYHYRMQLIHDATFHGYQQRALVAFSWCLAQFDKEPDDFDLDELLWRYKWIVGNIHAYPQVARSKIESLLDDMERRFDEAGYSQRAVHGLRLGNTIHIGDFETADEAFALWKKSKTDFMTDCRACEENRVVEYFASKEEDEAALKQATKLFDGKLTCAEVPHITVGHVVRPHMRTGQTDKVKELHRTWYPRLQDNQEFFHPVSELMLFWVAMGDLDLAKSMFEQHAPWADTANQDRRLRFLLTAWQLFEKLAATQSEVVVLVPQMMDIYESGGTYSTADLSDWFLKESQAVACQFDKRNQNQYCSSWIDKTRKLVEQC